MFSPNNSRSNVLLVAILLIFAAQTGLSPMALAQCQRAKLQASQPSVADDFGSSLALSAVGDVLLVGAPQADHGCFPPSPNCNAGEVVVFLPGPAGWVQQAIIVSPAPLGQLNEDLFGFAVALSADGNTALIGAPGDHTFGYVSGEAWVFRRPGPYWESVARLRAADARAYARFGAAVALTPDGRTALVGSPGIERVYVFRETVAGAWVEEAELKSLDARPAQAFGYSMAFAAAGEIALIGAPAGAFAENGSAYLFIHEGGIWTQTARIQSSGPMVRDHFGDSVAISESDDVAVINAPQAGRAYVFERINGQWTEQAQLPKEHGLFYPTTLSLSADGSQCLLGARYDSAQLHGEGAAYLYRHDGAEWTLLAQLAPTDPEPFKGFGTDSILSSDASIAAIGTSPTEHYTTTITSAYVFALRLPDTDADGVPDECDNCPAHANPDQGDCDQDGVGDVCEIAQGKSEDCNDNDLPDDCEISAPTIVTYQLDDGSPETAVGMYPWFQGITWLNQFETSYGGEEIVGIDIGWGFVEAGRPAILAIWNDPNNDGDPADAQLVASVGPIPVENPWTFIVNSVPVPPTYIGPAGTSFFVGAHLTEDFEEYPALIDQTPPIANRSWITSGPNFQNFATNPPHVVGSSNPATAGHWIIRARTAPERDCNNNGQLDECDISSGISPDINNNGIPDECEDLTCPADIAPLGPGGGGNGTVDVDDLLLIINRWGSCAAPCPPPCVGDISPIGGNCTVDIDDLMTVINAWGPCPPR